MSTPAFAIFTSLHFLFILCLPFLPPHPSSLLIINLLLGFSCLSLNQLYWGILVINFTLVVYTSQQIDALAGASIDELGRRLSTLNPRAQSHTQFVTQSLPRFIERIVNCGEKMNGWELMETEKMIGEKDLEGNVRGFVRRCRGYALGLYGVSVLVLVSGAGVRQVNRKDSSGWLVLGWVVLSDGLIFLRVFGPRRVDAVGGWLTTVRPNQQWYAPHMTGILFVLFVTRILLIITPSWLGFASQCLAYVCCASYLTILIVSIRNQSWYPWVLLGSMTFLMIITTILASEGEMDYSKAFKGGVSYEYTQSNGSMRDNTPILPPLSNSKGHVLYVWAFGLAAMLLVIAIAASHYAFWRFHNRPWLVWISVYGFWMLAGLLVDFATVHSASLETGVFVSVVTLCPWIFSAALGFVFANHVQGQEGGALEPYHVAKTLSCLLFSAGMLVAWSFSIYTVAYVSWYVFVAVLEIFAVQTFIVGAIIWYNRVAHRDAKWAQLLFGLSALACITSLSFVIPVAYWNASPATIWNKAAYGASAVSLTMLAGVLIWSACVVDLNEIGWDFFRSKLAHHVCLVLAIVLSTCLSLAGALLGWAIFYPDVGIWLVLSLVAYYFIFTGALSLLQRPFSQIETIMRSGILMIIAALSFGLAAGNDSPSTPRYMKATMWHEYLFAGAVLVAFACVEHVFSMFRAAPHKIICPSESWIMGVPIFVYVVERRGGEMTISNRNVLTASIGLVFLDALGFIVAYLSDPALGCILSSCCGCLAVILAHYLVSYRSRAFRKSLACIASTSGAEHALSVALKDTISRSKQMAPRAVAPYMMTSHWNSFAPKVNKEDRIAALFFVLFGLVAKRAVRKKQWQSQTEKRRHRALDPSVGTSLLRNEPKSTCLLKISVLPPASLLDGNPAEIVMATSEKFCDASFPPSDRFVYAGLAVDAREENLAIWLRPEDICKTRKFGLRSVDAQHRVDPRQVHQGQIGDCWLLSAISVVAIQDQLFDFVFPAMECHPNGEYHVRLFNFRNGEWDDVIVDDCIPCDPDSCEPLFAWSRSKQEFWMCLIEKAFAKTVGGWPRLENGQVHEALTCLTGGFSELFSVSEDFELVETDALWRRLVLGYREEFRELVVVGSKSGQGGTAADDDLFGLVPNHAYAVLDLIEIQDSRGFHRLLRLCDPWGKSNWSGQWSKLDHKSWTKRAEWIVEKQSFLAERPYAWEILKIGGGDDGTFWIEYDDFLCYFQWIFTCRFFPPTDGWVSASVMGEWTVEKNRNVQKGSEGEEEDEDLQYFTLMLGDVHDVGKTSLVFISICNTTDYYALGENGAQNDNDNDFMEMEYPFFSLLVLYGSGGDLGEQRTTVASTGRYKNARELSLEISLPKGVEFSLHPVLKRQYGKLSAKTFRISCFACCAISLKSRSDVPNV